MDQCAIQGLLDISCGGFEMWKLTPVAGAPGAEHPVIRTHPESGKR